MICTVVLVSYQRSTNVFHLKINFLFLFLNVFRSTLKSQLNYWPTIELVWWLCCATRLGIITIRMVPSVTAQYTLPFVTHTHIYPLIRICILFYLRVQTTDCCQSRVSQSVCVLVWVSRVRSSYVRQGYWLVCKGMEWTAVRSNMLLSILSIPLFASQFACDVLLWEPCCVRTGRLYRLSGR